MSDDAYELFKATLASQILSKTGASGDAGEAELDDFTDYLASEAWAALPAAVRAASFEHPAAAPELDVPAIEDSLVSYRLVADADDARALLARALGLYLREACVPPAVGRATRLSACEICEREIPLTYHHLIPRSTHRKVLRRKWHPPERLNAVAWICRYCHSTVHTVASNEELARNYYTVELLLERENILKWKSWASKQRYGKRRG